MHRITGILSILIVCPLLPKYHILLGDGTVGLGTNVQQQVGIHRIGILEHLHHLIGGCMLTVYIFVVSPGMRLKRSAYFTGFVLVQFIDLIGHFELGSHPGSRIALGGHEILITVGALLEGDQCMGTQGPDQGIGFLNGKKVGPAGKTP